VSDIDVISVSTSLIPPGPAYCLTVDGAEYTYGHPTYWTRKAIRPDVGMDAGNPWGSRRENAKIAFWEHVADRVEWYGSAKEFAADLHKRQLRAERERASAAAGHIDLF